MDRFNVAVTGSVLPGFAEDDVVVQLEAIFKTSRGAVTPLVSGRRLIIKRDVDSATAERYVLRLRDIGLGCELERARAPTSGDTSSPLASVVSFKQPQQVSPPLLDSSSETQVGKSGTLMQRVVMLVGVVCIVAGAVKLITSPAVVAGIASTFRALFYLVGTAMLWLGGATALISGLMFPRVDRRFKTGYKENRRVTWEGFGLVVGALVAAGGWLLLRWVGK